MRNDDAKGRIKQYAKKVEEDEEKPFWYNLDEIYEGKRIK